MSYIISHHDNYYTPGESLSELFKELVVKPFEDPNPLTQAWVDHVRNKDFKYHRETILEQGRTNFDEPFEGLTGKEKVLIYCLHYMPMHLFGSYHIFTNYLPSVNDKVVFVDFGCGPLTSGIAFWTTFARHRNITYLGIDNSHYMRHKAQEINRHGPYEDESFFPKGWSISDYNRLYHYLTDYITRGDQTQIIFNFCYFLASNTLNTLNIGALSDCLTQIVTEYNQHKMCMIYQNPIKSPDSHRNWFTIKEKLSTFRSQITQSNSEKFSCDWFRLQNERLIWRKSLPIDVYFDILSNDPSELSNDPFELPSIF